MVVRKIKSSHVSSQIKLEHYWQGLAAQAWRNWADRSATEDDLERDTDRLGSREHSGEKRIVCLVS